MKPKVPDSLFPDILPRVSSQAVAIIPAFCVLQSRGRPSLRSVMPTAPNRSGSPQTALLNLSYRIVFLITVVVFLLEIQASAVQPRAEGSAARPTRPCGKGDVDLLVPGLQLRQSCKPA